MKLAKKEFSPRALEMSDEAQEEKPMSYYKRRSWRDTNGEDAGIGFRAFIWVIGCFVLVLTFLGFFDEPNA